MITKIGQVGKAPSQLTYRGFRVERKGFLTTLSYAVDGVKRRFDVMERGHAVAVLPVDFRTRELYMLSEIRSNRPFGKLERGRAWIRKVLRDAFTPPEETFEVLTCEARVYELCAGMIDGDETPQAAAVRELREETGLVVGEDRLIAVGGHFPSIGGSTEIVHLFLVRLEEGHDASRVGTDGDGTEAMDILKMSWDDAFGLIKAGKIETTSTGLLLRELKIIDLEGRLAQRKDTP